MKPTADSDRTGWRRALLLLILVTLLLMTYRLDGTPFRGLYDDVDRSLIARNMVDSGDWIVATYLQGPLYTKPPLMYWTAAGLGVLTGRSDELPGNLASVLGMFLVVLATFWAGRNLFGTRAGLWAGLLLATMHLFLAMSRQALLDTVMMGGFALTFGAVVHLGFSGTRRATLWWLVAALGLALSFMTKGPVILPVFLLLWLPLLRQVPDVRPGRRQVVFALAVIAAVTLPWPIALLKAAPEALQVWQSELFGRFGDGKQYHAWTQKPVWFYLPDLANTLPWLLLVPWAVIRSWPRRRDPRFGFLLWWAVGGLVFFSLASATKRSYYLLPLYPAFALLVAGQWELLTRQVQAPSFWKARFWPLLTFGLLVVAGVAFVVLPFLFPDVPKTAFTCCGIITTICGGAALAMAGKGRWGRALALGLAGATAIHLAYFGHHVPRANTFFSAKPFYLEARALLEDQEVTLLEVPIALAAFYLHETPWRYTTRGKFAAEAAPRPGDWVIARPEDAIRFPGLQPVLVREFTEPFGKKKGLGLYRHQPSGSAADRSQLSPGA